MFKVRFNRTNVAVEIEPVCRLGADHRPGAPKKRARLGRSTLLSTKFAITNWLVTEPSQEMRTYRSR
jgi:hypothetical protein